LLKNLAVLARKTFNLQEIATLELASAARAIGAYAQFACLLSLQMGVKN
jgi:hypothetical protein